MIKFYYRDLGVDVVGYYMFYFKRGNKLRFYLLFICDDSINVKCKFFFKSNIYSFWYNIVVFRSIFVI